VMWVIANSSDGKLSFLPAG